jgi:hypothetical protein
MRLEPFEQPALFHSNPFAVASKGSVQAPDFSLALPQRGKNGHPRPI